MRLLVTGPRDWPDYHTVFEVLDGINSATPVTRLIEGGALGVDRFARRWAEERCVPYETYAISTEEWTTLGRAAGPIRNARMITAGKPDRCVAFIAEPPTPGTANCVRQAKRAGVPVFEVGIGATPPLTASWPP